MIPKIIFSDVDGTLLKPDGTLSTETKAAIKRVEQKGIPFVLVSARSPQEMFDLHKELELHSPVISYNGGLIFELHDGSMNVLTSIPIKSNEPKTMYDIIMARFPSLHVNIYSDTKWFAERYDQWLQMEIDITGLTPEYHNLEEILNSGFPIHKIMLIGDAEMILEAERTLVSFEGLTSSIYKSSENYLEITNQKATKLEGMKMVLEKHYPDIQPAEVMAAGDGHNDWDMLKYAGFGVAMGNAPKEIKESMKYITDTNAEDGLVKAINRMILDEGNL